MAVEVRLEGWAENTDISPLAPREGLSQGPPRAVNHSNMEPHAGRIPPLFTSCSGFSGTALKPASGWRWGRKVSRQFSPGWQAELGIVMSVQGGGYHFTKSSLTSVRIG